ncbi:MAG: carbamoyltransferase HypF [Bacteroidales bacterium]
MESYLIQIKGLVQGIGFRPFIYRICQEMNIKGVVSNNNEGVEIEIIKTSDKEKERLLSRIQNEKPFAATINQISVRKTDTDSSYSGFSIVPSKSLSDQVTHVSPDIAVCTHCLEDMKNQKNRKDYPFINCTHCGPRFTIIRELPYDRKQTSMAPFEMCPDCRKEYEAISDRRFHAQPTACNVCGPAYYTAVQKTETEYIVSSGHFFENIAAHIRQGNILSLKGLGGYNLLCDAFNPDAVRQLRTIKQRDAKPFAIMFRSEKAAGQYVFLSPEERQQLVSWQRPIVLLKQRKTINEAINGGLNTIGVLLPYLPAHYLLFEKLSTDALVFTSGNLSDEPIIIDNTEARKKLLPLTQLQGEHNRDIVNRADDSLIQVIRHIPRLLRRSRGYVPHVHASALQMEGILAFGAEKVNTFAIGKSCEVIMSQYIGDLKNKETFDFYKEAIDNFSRLFRFAPLTLACDLHPDYYSSRYAAEMAQSKNLKLYPVQHHHAHAVACMEEHHLTGNHLAIILDGTGYGTDHQIWGGEFLICNHTSFTREAHLDYIPLPGADKAIKEPWRMAAALFEHYHLPLPDAFEERHRSQIELIQKMVRQKINSPLSSGAGRLFDGVSALLGCCEYASFQAEAPLRLEHLAEDNYNLTYSFDELNPLNCCSLLNEIGIDLQRGLRKSLIAAKFHNTFVKQLIYQTKIILRENELPPAVILSGGCFQNKRLSFQLEQELVKTGIKPIVPQAYPANDGGIALGQISIAAALRKETYA